MRAKFPYLIFILLTTFICIEADADAADFFLSTDYSYRLGKNHLAIEVNSPDLSCNSAYKFEENKRHSFNISPELIFKDKYILGLSLGYNIAKINVVSYTDELIGLNEDYYDALIETAIHNDMENLNLGITFGRCFLEKKMTIGINIGLNYTINADYYQHEKIIEPIDKAVFQETGERVRHQLSSNNTDVSAYSIPVSLFLKTYLPMNDDKTMLLTPMLALGVEHSIIEYSNNLANQNLTHLFFSLGAGVTYKLTNKK